MKSKYRHLFFDLDHTLWDFETNSRATLQELFEEFELAGHTGATYPQFLKTYYRINDRKWKLYRKGKIDKNTLRYERVAETLVHYECFEEEMARTFDRQYIERCPLKTDLMVGCRELLDYLAPRYQLHIITNGFRETQAIKLRQSGLEAYFNLVITSDEMPAHKPDARIFMESLKRAGATRKNSLMVGDNLEADIAGARNCGIDQVYYNPKKYYHRKKATFEVEHLCQLKNFL